MDENERFYLYKIGHEIMKGYEKQEDFWIKRNIQIVFRSGETNEYEIIKDHILIGAWKIFCYAFSRDFHEMEQKDEFWHLIGETDFINTSAEESFADFKDRIMQI